MFSPSFPRSSLRYPTNCLSVFTLALLAIVQVRHCLFSRAAPSPHFARWLYFTSSPHTRKRTIVESRVTVCIYRVVFFNWASPEFAKCWPVSNWFQKNIRVPDWPPIGIENVKVFGISPFSAAILRTFPKQGGGQSRDIFRGGPVKKKHPVFQGFSQLF